MKNFRYKLLFKVTVFITLFISALVAAISIAGVTFLLYNDSYRDGGGQLVDSALSNDMFSDAHDIWQYYMAETEGDESTIINNDYQNRFDEKNSNLFYLVENDENEVVFQNYYTDTYSTVKQYTFVLNESTFQISRSFDSVEDALSFYNGLVLRDTEEKVIITNKTMDDTTVSYEGYNYEDYTMTLFLREDLAAKDKYYTTVNFLNMVVEMRYFIIAVAALFLLLSVVQYILLVCSAGHVYGEEKIQRNFLDVIPFDVYLVLLLGILAALFFAFRELFDRTVFSDIFFMIAVFFSFMALSLSFATRIKTNTIIKNNLLTILFRALCKFGKFIAQSFVKLVKGIGIYWKVALVFVLLTLVDLLLLVSSSQVFTVFWIILRVIIFVFLAYFTICLQRLKKAGDELSKGNTSYKTDLKYLPLDLKAHGESLNMISEGFSNAVDERIRSERMKAELVTNVSHDIKTPLTSIINYVDLLKRDGLDNENAAEYLEVLERQSARLKKLIEDLIEVSKASTGNLSVTPEPIDINVLLSQAIGEYEDKFKARGLVTVTALSNEAITVLADGKYLWRVIDNLFNNVSKYALDGTRVYITEEIDGKRIRLSIKNISKEMISLSVDDLTERFVRGDSSRNTEGSGLGLSIAKNLIELQGGSLDIETDGDLFKIVLTMDIYSE